MTCSPGLLWNGIKNECDFPENVDCNLSSEALAKHKVSPHKYLRSSNPAGVFRELHLHDI